MHPRLGPAHLFDGADHLKLGRGVEVVALLAQQQAEVPRDVPPGDVHTHDGVRNGEALVDGHHVGHAVARVEHDAGGAARGVPAGGRLGRLAPRSIQEWVFFFFSFFFNLYLQTEDSLHGDEEGGNVEGLEENLGRLLPVLAGVEGSFGEQHRMLRTERGDRVTRLQLSPEIPEPAVLGGGKLTSSEKVCSCSLE